MAYQLKKHARTSSHLFCKKTNFLTTAILPTSSCRSTTIGRAFRRIILMIHKSSTAAGNVHCGRSEATNLPQSPTQQGLLGSVRPTNGLCAFKSSTVVNGCLSATVWLRRDGDGTILTYYYYHIGALRPPVETEPGTCHRKFKWKFTFLLCTIC